MLQLPGGLPGGEGRDPRYPQAEIYFKTRNSELDAEMSARAQELDARRALGKGWGRRHVILTAIGTTAFVIAVILAYYLLMLQ